MSRHIAEQFEMPFASLTIQIFESNILERPVAHIQLRGKLHPLCGWAPHVTNYFKKPHREVSDGFTICKTCAKAARKRGLKIN
jgi:hypothetical protein